MEWPGAVDRTLKDVDPHWQKGLMRSTGRHGGDAHLLPRDQEDGALFGVHHLPENVVQYEEFTPTVLEKLHLVVNLRRDQQMCKK